MAPRWIDNHCHLDGEDDPGGIVAEANAAGVSDLVCVGVDVERTRRCLEVASAHDGVWATAGVHPHESAGGIHGLEEAIEAGLEAGVLVAVGECGLDHHYDHSPRDAQRREFAAQIRLAHHFELPLVIHTREAWDDTFAVLDAEGIPPRTVFHCFTGGPQEAAAALERGALLSVSGIVTFPSATGLREAVAAAPLGRLMVETDAPYLAPVPHRGVRNRPAWVTRVGEAVAALTGHPVEHVAEQTVRTTVEFYSLPHGGSA